MIPGVSLKTVSSPCSTHPPRVPDGGWPLAVAFSAFCSLRHRLCGSLRHLRPGGLLLSPCFRRPSRRRVCPSSPVSFTSWSARPLGISPRLAPPSGTSVAPRSPPPVRRPRRQRLGVGVHGRAESGQQRLQPCLRMAEWDAEFGESGWRQTAGGGPAVCGRSRLVSVLRPLWPSAAVSDLPPSPLPSSGGVSSGVGAEGRP